MADRRELDQQWYESFDEKHMTIFVELTNDEGETARLAIPAHFDVCATCGGRGRHVNPGIDSNGLTSEDFAQDPDFRHDYFSGVYDVDCNECHGRRVVPCVSWDTLDAPTRKLVEDYMNDFHQAQVEDWHARRYGY